MTNLAALRIADRPRFIATMQAALDGRTHGEAARHLGVSTRTFLRALSHAPELRRNVHGRAGWSTRRTP